MVVGVGGGEQHMCVESTSESMPSKGLQCCVQHCTVCACGGGSTSSHAGGSKVVDAHGRGVHVCFLVFSAPHQHRPVGVSTTCLGVVIYLVAPYLPPPQLLVAAAASAGSLGASSTFTI